MLNVKPWPWPGAWDLGSKKLLEGFFQNLSLGVERNTANGPTCGMERSLRLGPEATVGFWVLQVQAGVEVI